MKLKFNKIKTPKINCQTQPIDKNPIIWPKLIKHFKSEDFNYCIRPIDTADIPSIAKLYQTFCPYFYQSSAQYLMEEEFYQKEVCLLSQWAKDQLEKYNFMGLIENQETKEIVMAFGCRRDPYDLVIQNLAVVANPQYRGQQLGYEYANYMDELWQKSGTDYVYGFMTTQNTYSQKIFLKLGLGIGAIMPGQVLRTYDGENYYRDSQIFVYKFYNDSEKYTTSLKNCQLDPSSLADIKELIRQVEN